MARTKITQATKPAASEAAAKSVSGLSDESAPAGFVPGSAGRLLRGFVEVTDARGRVRRITAQNFRYAELLEQGLRDGKFPNARIAKFASYYAKRIRDGWPLAAPMDGGYDRSAEAFVVSALRKAGLLSKSSPLAAS